jgi:hypothetical protein
VDIDCVDTRPVSRVIAVLKQTFNSELISAVNILPKHMGAESYRGLSNFKDTPLKQIAAYLEIYDAEIITAAGTLKQLK